MTERDKMIARQKANDCNQDRIPSDWGRPCCDICVCAAQADGRDGVAEHQEGLVRVATRQGLGLGHEVHRGGWAEGREGSVMSKRTSIAARTILLAATILAIWNVDWAQAWAAYQSLVVHAWGQYLSWNMDLPSDRLQKIAEVMMVTAMPPTIFMVAMRGFCFVWEALGKSKPQPAIDMTVD